MRVSLEKLSVCEITCSTALPEVPGKFSLKGIFVKFPKELGDDVPYKGPEHKIRTILKSHPRRPVPMTAIKMAAGAQSDVSVCFRGT